MKRHIHGDSNTGFPAVSLLPSPQRSLPQSDFFFPPGKRDVPPPTWSFHSYTPPEGPARPLPMLQCSRHRDHPQGTPHTSSEDSLLKELLPVRLDEIPGQSLPHDIVGDANDGGGGILLPDEGGVQGVTQVPVGAGCSLVATCQGCSLMTRQRNPVGRGPAPPCPHPLLLTLTALWHAEG